MVYPKKKGWVADGYMVGSVWVLHRVAMGGPEWESERNRWGGVRGFAGGNRVFQE